MSDALTLTATRQSILTKALSDTVDKYWAEVVPKHEAARLLWAALPIYRSLLPDLDEVHQERRLWDVAFDAVRSVAIESPRSFLVRWLATVLGCGEVVEKTQVYLARSLAFTKRGLQVRRAELPYAAAIARFDDVDENLLGLYASLVAFPRDEQLHQYVEHAVELERLKLELVIEGPIQLVLSISESGVEALAKLPFWLGGNHEPDVTDLLLVLSRVKDRLSTSWDGGMLRDLADVADETIDLYGSRLRSNLMLPRSFVPTQAAKERFRLGFESGEYRQVA